MVYTHLPLTSLSVSSMLIGQAPVPLGGSLPSVVAVVIFIDFYFFLLTVELAQGSLWLMSDSELSSESPGGRFPVCLQPALPAMGAACGEH